MTTAWEKFPIHLWLDEGGHLNIGSVSKGWQKSTSDDLIPGTSSLANPAGYYNQVQVFFCEEAALVFVIMYPKLEEGMLWEMWMAGDAWDNAYRNSGHLMRIYDGSLELTGLEDALKRRLLQISV